ncbi:MAG: VOC family protein [Sediminibacterium sp.]|nr:VOC family protein [Sediminibacterium sp.]
MLTSINPKLPMHDLCITQDYYVNKLGFEILSNYGDYLILQKDNIEIHFFIFKGLDPKKNYGQVYIRTDNIVQLFKELNERKVIIHPNGNLETKPWGQKEFSLLDPDNNLLTFGQNIA